MYCSGNAPVKFVIFGLTVSSSWGNGHATTWRGLLKALRRAGHEVVFFERNVPYYAQNRDLPEPDFCQLVLYDDWSSIQSRAAREVTSADTALVTSFCADGFEADRLVLDAARPLRVFYDIDTPVTLAELERSGVATAGGARYLTPELMSEFDLYLSFTGGPVLDELRSRWHVKEASALYCSVDPETHAQVAPVDDFRCALSYLGTYSADRQAGLERLLLRPALDRPDERFSVAGAQYPTNVRWPANVSWRSHLAPADHPAFYCSSRLTLNVTRQAMILTGYAPSVRLFEAASCGVPVISDAWPGLDELFVPGQEIVIAGKPADVHAALDLTDTELQAIGAAARQRALAEHSCDVRAAELIAACDDAASGQRVSAPR